MTYRQRTSLFLLSVVLFSSFRLVIGGDTDSFDAHPGLPLSASIKVISVAAPTSPPLQAMQAVEEQVIPATPSGKLPQYQLGHLHRQVPDESAIDDPRLRLLLALPDAPLLIEATITIDGMPYLHLREERVQQLLKFASDPNPEARNAALAAQGERQAQAVIAEQLGKLVTDAPESDASSDAGETAGNLAEQATGLSVVPVFDAVVGYSEQSPVYDRISRYVAATEEVPTAAEIRWMLTDWVDGPEVLLLNDNYQRFRSDQRPVFDILDRDRDQTISAQELKLAMSSFRECDLNGDDLVQYSELVTVAQDPRLQAKHAGHGKLTFLLPNSATAVGIYERLAHRYQKHSEDSVFLPRFDSNQNGQFDAEEIQDLKSRDADLKMDVKFYTAAPGKSRIEITAVAEEFLKSDPPPVQYPGGITLRLGGALVEFCAVQRAQSDQISVGAVDDGYPMLPVVDPNDDGRLTIRELRSLNDRLEAFDVSQDGTLTPDEVRSTIRVCIGRGPVAHVELSSIRRRGQPDAAPSVTGPDWFTRMDANKDGDLTRNEFLGSDEHFSDADVDADTLVSAAEAVAYESNSKK